MQRECIPIPKYWALWSAYQWARPYPFPTENHRKSCCWLQKEICPGGPRTTLSFGSSSSSCQFPTVLSTLKKKQNPLLCQTPSRWLFIATAQRLQGCEEGVSPRADTCFSQLSQFVCDCFKNLFFVVFPAVLSLGGPLSPFQLLSL